MTSRLFSTLNNNNDEPAFSFLVSLLRGSRFSLNQGVSPQTLQLFNAPSVAMYLPARWMLVSAGAISVFSALSHTNGHRIKNPQEYKVKCLVSFLFL